MKDILEEKKGEENWIEGKADGGKDGGGVGRCSGV